MYWMKLGCTRERQKKKVIIKFVSHIIHDHGHGNTDPFSFELVLNTLTRKTEIRNPTQFSTTIMHLIRHQIEHPDIIPQSSSNFQTAWAPLFAANRAYRSCFLPLAKKQWCSFSTGLQLFAKPTTILHAEYPAKPTSNKPINTFRSFHELLPHDLTSISSNLPTSSVQNHRPWVAEMALNET